MASYVSNCEGQLPGRLQRVQVTDYHLVECIWLLPTLNPRLVLILVLICCVRKEHSDDSKFGIVDECLKNCQHLVSSDSIETRLMSIRSMRKDF